MHRSTIPARDGARLRVRDWGAGRPALFLSGWGLPSDFWQHHAADLARRGLRCVAYDRRGHGRSDEPGSGYDYDTLADDLAAVLDGLDLAAVTLVAYSMAGGEAVRCLSRHGRARVRGLVLVSATTPFLLQAPDNPDGVPAPLLEEARRAIAEDFPKWLADNEAAYWLGHCSPELRAWTRGLMEAASVPALLECHRAMAGTDFRAELARLDLPTLVVHGDRDASAPLALTGARTAGLVPGARLSVYEGAPHGLPLTHRRRFVEEIAAFAGTR